MMTSIPARICLLESLCPPVSGWPYNNLVIKCVLFLLYLWIAYLPHPYICISFCLTVLGIFMLMWIPCAHILKTDFLLLICGVIINIWPARRIKGAKEDVPALTMYIMGWAVLLGYEGLCTYYSPTCNTIFYFSSPRHLHLFHLFRS